jgi:hypothetical protein
LHLKILFNKESNQMRKKSELLCALLITGIMIACAGAGVKPTNDNFSSPRITFSHAELVRYWGWWYYSISQKPIRGKAGNYGAPLVHAFIFKIHNPNKYPIKMESIKFTAAFEDFDLHTVNSSETQWIPAGKTNELRMTAVTDGRSALLRLLANKGYKLKQKKVSVWNKLEEWWDGAPDFSFPIHIKKGAAVFRAGNLTRVVSFQVKYP